MSKQTGPGTKGSQTGGTPPRGRGAPAQPHGPLGSDSPSEAVPYRPGPYPFEVLSPRRATPPGGGAQRWAGRRGVGDIGLDRLRLDEALSALRGSGAAGRGSAAGMCEAAGGGAREDRRAEAGESGARRAAHLADAAALLLFEGQSGDGAPGVEGDGAGDAGQEAAPKAQGGRAAVRALHAEPDVAERHHLLPDPGQAGLHYRVRRRSLPLPHRPGHLPQPDQRVRG